MAGKQTAGGFAGQALATIAGYVMGMGLVVATAWRFNPRLAKAAVAIGIMSTLLRLAVLWGKRAIRTER